jgi:hypothetical protein
MASESGMVSLNVQLEMVEQVVFSEEVQHCGRVEVVLVLGWLHWLGFNQELSFVVVSIDLHKHTREEGRKGEEGVEERKGGGE